MTSFARRSLIVSLLAAAAIAAGCGGGSQSSSSQATSAPTTEAQREQGALPSSSMQPIPKDLGCTGDDVVWVNMNTKSYHEPSDPYYGRTKNGKYMCKSAADAAGYHMAGSMHSHHSKNSSGNMPSDNGTPSDSGT